MGNFPIWCPESVWYLILWIPDLCLMPNHYTLCIHMQSLIKIYPVVPELLSEHFH